MKKLTLEFFRKSGAKGGKSRSRRKLAAVRANAKKAHAALRRKRAAEKRKAMGNEKKDS